MFIPTHYAANRRYQRTSRGFLCSLNSTKENEAKTRVKSYSNGSNTTDTQEGVIMYHCLFSPVHGCTWKHLKCSIFPAINDM